MQAADPVVEPPRTVGQQSPWRSEQRLDLVGHQLESERETGPGRVQEEIPPEAGVRQQATERALDVQLTHAFLPVLVARKDRTQLGQPIGAVLVRFGARMCNVTPEREDRHPLGPRSRPRENS